MKLAAAVSIFLPLLNTVNSQDEDTAVKSALRKTDAGSRRTQSNYCGCQSCTGSIWNLNAGGYSCGARISWLQSWDGGLKSEYAACKQVSGEFPTICGPDCHPDLCSVTTTTTTTATTTTTTTSSTTTNALTYCGCPECTTSVWNRGATDGGGTYTCGARISWLQSASGGSYSQYSACRKVSLEFPSICGPKCNPEMCNATPAPTNLPTKEPTPNPTVHPSTSPTKIPTMIPTLAPSRKPTPLPSSQPTNEPTHAPSINPTSIPTPKPTNSPTNTITYCGCPECITSVWNSNAGGYSCGDRISWLQSWDGGLKSQDDACLQVSLEFPAVCGPMCNPKTCGPTTTTTSTTTTTTSTATTTPKPTPMPTTTSVTHCGCPDCTDAYWNALATDSGGTYSCGARISWLQTPEGGSNVESDACAKVSGEFPLVCGGTECNPLNCNSLLEDPDPNNLIWSDEFDTNGFPDPTKWSYNIGDGCNIGICGWGNGEQQYYTNSTSNAYVSGGILQIIAKKESGYSSPYTSSRMITRGLQSFKYGRIQIRANLSKCKAVGTWPALWMLPESKVYGNWPDSGEIDIMETVGHESNKFHGTVHTEAYNHMSNTQKGGSITKSKDEWHVFEVIWEEDLIRFAVDSHVYYDFPKGATSAEWPFDQDFHILMNIAVGGSWGGAQGVDAASFEGVGQIMEVDWVRAYSS